MTLDEKLKDMERLLSQEFYAQVKNDGTVVLGFADFKIHCAQIREAENALAALRRCREQRDAERLGRSTKGQCIEVWDAELLALLEGEKT